MTFDDLSACVELWASEKGLFDGDNSRVQMLKVVEEVGETSRAILKGDRDGIRDGIGDVVVTLIILARMEGYDLRECLGVAWDEIKDRRGATVNGTFIKEVL